MQHVMSHYLFWRPVHHVTLWNMYAHCLLTITNTRRNDTHNNNYSDVVCMIYWYPRRSAFPIYFPSEAYILIGGAHAIVLGDRSSQEIERESKRDLESARERKARCKKPKMLVSCFSLERHIERNSRLVYIELSVDAKRGKLEDSVQWWIATIKGN